MKTSLTLAGILAVAIAAGAASERTIDRRDLPPGVQSAVKQEEAKGAERGGKKSEVAVNAAGARIKS